MVCCSLTDITRAFQHNTYPTQRRPQLPSATRLHLDSLLEEWWKGSGGPGGGGGGAVMVPSVLDLWNNHGHHRHDTPRVPPAPQFQSVTLLEPQGKQQLRQQQRCDFDEEKYTAPGLGTFEFLDGDEDDEYILWDRLLSRSTSGRKNGNSPVVPQRNDTTSILSQRRNHTGGPSTTTNRTEPPKRRSVVDSPLGKLPRSTKSTTNTTKTPNKKKKARDSIATLLPGKKPTDVLTVADMERILKAQKAKSSNNQVSSRSDKTAFPQPSVLAPSTLQWGATVAGGLYGTVLAASALPNLWLAGCMAGSVFGHGVNATSDQAVAKLCYSSGQALAKAYLKLYDTVQTVFFLYKTGQLSYTYYQQYQNLDQRFGIQTKMDAWNARFVQGKRNFDAWEQENEIGRKVLAALRTAWLVEEQRGSRRRWRVGQWIRQPSKFVTAVGSAAALGTVWAVLPSSVVVGLALILGYIWPTWLVEGARRLRHRIWGSGGDGLATLESLEAEDRSTTTKVVRPSAHRSWTRQLASPWHRPKKDQYHSYVRANGQRRYYRVGQPVWPWQAAAFRRTPPPPPRWQVWRRRKRT